METIKKEIVDIFQICVQFIHITSIILLVLLLSSAAIALAYSLLNSILNLLPQ